MLVEQKNIPIIISYREKRLFIDRNDCANGNVVNIVSRESSRGRIVLFSVLSDHGYNTLQNIIIKEFSGNSEIMFVKCYKFARDIVKEIDLKKQIALFHNLKGVSWYNSNFRKNKS